MQHKIITMAAIALAATAGGAISATAISKDAPAARVSKAPKAEAIGKPQSCIGLRQIRSSKVRDDYTIDFETAGGKTYRNELPYRCSGLGFEEAFSYKTSLNQLCDVDIITVLRSTGGRLDSGPSCGLGKFQQVKIIKEPKS